MRRFVSIIALGLALGITSSALADGKAPRPLAASLTGEAATSYQSARLLFEDEDRAGALEKFKRAYELSKDPRLLWNMAVCEKELRHYAQSSALIDQYLHDGGDKVTADARKSALDTQSALHSFFSLATIDGAPAGAHISIDGTDVGTAPLSAPVPLDLGRRVIRADLDGYQPFSTTLDIPGNTTTTVTVDMQVEVVSARLNVSSAGARDVIKIDGKTVATEHWEGTLAPGQHSLRVSADGMKPYETEILLGPHATRSITVALQTEEHKKAIWPWLVGGAAVAGGIVVGGFLLFKPKDEAGSTPAGKLATVTLPGS